MADWKTLWENYEVEAYVIEIFDKIKGCYVFWNVVSSYKEAKKYIYKYMMEFSIADDGKIGLSDGQINEYDYFTVSCSFNDSPTITDKFRGHIVTFVTNDIERWEGGKL